MMRSHVTTLAATATILAAPLYAQARTTPVAELPTPLTVTQTTAELEELGCRAISARGDSVDTPNEITYLIAPADPQTDQYLFCAEDIVPSLHQTNGQVAGITSEASAAGVNCLSDLSANAKSLDPGELLTQWRNCTLGAGSVAGITDGTPGASAQVDPGTIARGVFGGLTGVGGNSVLATVIAVLQWLLIGFIGIGSLLLFGGVTLVNFALSPTQFATHAVVQQMWPFVLGIANLGFILALLAIAFGTVLQIQDFAARRMLPRLLFAALLINFSLLVGTLIVDASRLTMAIELSVLNAGQGVADIAEVGNQILEASKIDQLVSIALYTSQTSILAFGNDSVLSDAWTGLATVAFAAVLVWGAAIGFIIIGVMLVVRYIAILLLLIVSPLAFLAIALPRAGKMASRWWTEFIKYVLYGPAVLLILIILMRAQEVANFFGRIPQGQPALVTWFTLIATTAITIILLYMAATAGRYLGLAGASATVGFVSGKAKQAARLYGKGVGAAGKGLYIGSGARRGVRNVRDATREAIKPVQKQFGLGKYSKYDDKGQLKTGKTSAGARFGQAVGRGLPKQLGGSPEASANIAAAKALNSTTLGRSQLHTNAAVSPDKLASPDIISNLQTGTLGDLITRGRADQRQGLAAGVGLVDTVPNPKAFLDTTVDQSINLMQQAEATINNPASSNAQKQAATRDKNGAGQILRNLVKNSGMVEAMGDSHKGKLLSMGDMDVNRELFRTMAQIRSREAKN